MGIEIINTGVTYQVDDGIKFDVLDFDGFSLPEIRSTLESFSQQNGANWIGFRLSPRKVLLKVIIYASSLSQLFDRRTELMQIFQPSNAAIYLKWTMPNGSVRQIDCFPTGGLLMPAREIRGTRQVTVIEMICPDPVWYNPVAGQVLVDMPAFTNLVFPIKFPIKFGSVALDYSYNLTYNGNWPEFPKILIAGSVSGFYVENLSTGEKIGLDYAIPVGRTVTIDLKPGAKQVYDDLGTNLIGCVTTDSDLSTFHLAPAPEVAGGINQMHFLGSGLTADSQVTFQYFDRYLGL
jgi:hypothetical protein